MVLFFCSPGLGLFDSAHESQLKTKGKGEDATTHRKIIIIIVVMFIIIISSSSSGGGG